LPQAVFGLLLDFGVGLRLQAGACMGYLLAASLLTLPLAAPQSAGLGQRYRHFPVVQRSITLLEASACVSRRRNSFPQPHQPLR